MHARGGQLEPGFVVAGYRIDELISRGGMGEVYRVTNIALNRIYALKVLASQLADDPGFRERFKREMRIAASIKHPNVVSIHYAGEQDGLVFFVMDFVYGSDLREVIRNSGPIEPSRAVDLLVQFASALDAAHARGLVHRDVKSANILITVSEGEEHAYLTDFGVAKRANSAAGLTAQGAVVGTVDYMSPEQITGRHTDARTDVYALGCVFFQMLTGNVPFERENSIAKLFAHVHDDPPAIEGPVADHYPAFRPVLEKAMAKDPADRYLSAGDFARDATAALRGTRYTGPETTVGVGDAKPSDADTTADREPAPLLDPRDAELDRTTAAARVQAQPGAGAEAAAKAEEAEESEESATATPPAAPATAASSPPAPTTIAASPGHPRRRRLAAALVALAVVGAIVVAIIAIGSGSGGGGAQGGLRLSANAQPVPTNRVTGSGTATVSLSGAKATVTLDTRGLLDGSPHAMHIHAGGQGVCPPASAARLHNGHLAISTTNGIHFYGPPEVALTSHGDTSPKSIVDFTRYPSLAAITYKRTVTVPRGVADAIRAGNAVIVVHGIDYNHNGIYDDVLDRSELKATLPGEATAPALCGPLHTNAVAATGGRGGGIVYAAALHPYEPALSAEEKSFRLLCRLAGVPA